MILNISEASVHLGFKSRTPLQRLLRDGLLDEYRAGQRGRQVLLETKPEGKPTLRERVQACTQLHRGSPLWEVPRAPAEPAAAQDLKRSIAQLPDEEIPELGESRARREHFEAELALLRLEQQRGDLVDAAAVRKEAFAMGRSVRDALMTLPDRLASQLAGTMDAEQCHRLLTEELRGALRSLASAEE